MKNIQKIKQISYETSFAKMYNNKSVRCKLAIPS